MQMFNLIASKENKQLKDPKLKTHRKGQARKYVIKTKLLRTKQSNLVLKRRARHKVTNSATNIPRAVLYFKLYLLCNLRQNISCLGIYFFIGNKHTCLPYIGLCENMKDNKGSSLVKTCRDG